MNKNRFEWIVAVGIFLVLGSAVWLASATSVSAQCGSQASSCKNCHEVQGEMSVNNDGTSWHEAHAFGDFCYVCHAGNSQATDKAEAHTGMEPPLADIKASCQQCHVGDLDERAQVYAAALGIEIGAGAPVTGAGSGSESVSAESVDNAAPVTVAVSAPVLTELDVNDPNIVDYVQRYERDVLGKTKNWGNITLVVLIALLVVGGSGFVLYREGWISLTTEALQPLPEGYPSDIVEMLPKLKLLDDKGRQGLRSLVEDSKAANELLDVVGRYTSKKGSQQ